MSETAPRPAETCGASTGAIRLGDEPPFRIGPCVLRKDHDGPVHQAQDGTQWAGDVGRAPETAPRPDVPDVPEPPDDRPTADRNAVDRARTDGGARALIARALWRRDTQPTTGAQTMGYVYELADRVATHALPEIERRGHLLNPPDVSPELVIRAAKASSLHFELCDFGDSWQDCQDCRRAYDRAHYAVAAVVPVIERRAVEADRAAIVKNIRHYFAASEDPLYEDVEVLCGRIERGEYGARKEGR